MLTEAVGREITYIDTDGPIKEFFAAFGEAETMVTFYNFERLISGKIPANPALLEKLLGRKPVSLQEFVQENAAVWKQ